MPKSAAKPAMDQIIPTILVTVLLGIVVYAILYVGNLSVIQDLLARKESVLANSSADYGGASMIIRYNFDYNGARYSGDETCTNCAAQFEQARTGHVLVWFDPENPNNSSIRKTGFIIRVILYLLYWGMLVFVFWVEIVFLKKMFPKAATTMAEMGIPGMIQIGSCEVLIQKNEGRVIITKPGHSATIDLAPQYLGKDPDPVSTMMFGRAVREIMSHEEAAQLYELLRA